MDGRDRRPAGPARARFINPMGFQKLQSLAAGQPRDIALQVDNEQTGFAALLKLPPRIGEAHFTQRVELILQVLHAGASRETGLHYVRIGVFTKFRFSKFLKECLPDYIRDLYRNILHVSDDNIYALGICLQLFKELLRTQPSSFDEVFPVFGVLQTVFYKIQTAEMIEVKVLLREVDELLESCRMETEGGGGRGPPSQGRAVGARRQADIGPPPDNYKELSVTPFAEEMLNTQQPYLRANRANEAFRDLDEYLDVHFRLLREDFIRPLRHAIQSIIHVGEGKQTEKDVRIYSRVKILFPVCDMNGLSYTVRFELRKKISWKFSRRLMYGSMVCLSADNFQTLYFATVSNRDPEKLQEGLVDLQFTNPEVPAAENHTFTMIETKSYFEACRHVLSGLQDIEEIPFENILVNGARDIEPPEYLLEGQGRHGLKTFNFRSICSGLTGADDEFAEVALGNLPSWPPRDILQLDDSQFRAVASSLRRRVSLIQGPPGTGKTYVGLKLIHALLANADLWSDDGPAGPILVVCYTNHALDQFLEGILPICETLANRGIVRVGGRSKSEQLKDYYLRRIRENMRDKRQIPQEIFLARSNARSNMQTLEEEIERIAVKIEATFKGVLHEEQLKEYMRDHHYRGLLQLFGLEIDRDVDEEDLGGLGGRREAVLNHWLGLGEVVYRDEPQAGVEEDAVNIPLENEAVVSDEDNSTVADESESEDEVEERRMFALDEEAEDDRRNARHAEHLRQAQEELALNLDDLEDDEAEHHMPRGRGGQAGGKKYVSKQLKRLDHLSEEEVDRIRNIWALPPNVRWKLYRYWLSRYRAGLLEKLGTKDTQYAQQTRRLKDIMAQEDCMIMEKASVIGMTTTGAARYKHVLQHRIRPKIVIVEEAAEVLEAHVVTSLSPACQHLILIGDHQQLRPKPNVYELGETYGLKVSMFERLVNIGIPHETLEYQHRMRPEISALIRPMYKNLKDHSVVESMPDVKGLEKNLCFIPMGKEEEEYEELNSKSNELEARYIMELCKYLLLQGYEQEQITVLSPYAGQIAMIKTHVSDEDSAEVKGRFRRVKMCAVDNFQGEENDIILLSLVRSNSEDQLGFLKEPNRVCVALSRAKRGLYVVGNFDFLARNNELWDEIVQQVKAAECFGALVLRCANHPQQRITVGKISDFDEAPEGGCKLQCDFRLPCGHTCQMVCHPRDHENYKCRQPCAKSVCTNTEHKCNKLCFQNCGVCQYKETKQLPCGHSQSVVCSADIKDVTCDKPCLQRMTCGHLCQNPCSRPHSLPSTCPHPATKTWPCGHTTQVKCCDTHCPRVTCSEPCQKVLTCGHDCQGTCGECFNGRLHVACQEKCKRDLVCGHPCSSPCPRSCQSCDHRCENHCQHSRCPKKCGEPCQPCREPCVWECRHYRCTKLCHEPCDRPRCNKPCRKLLKCDHPCVGLCGEVCPTLCRICDKDVLQELFLGGEDDPDARYVSLEDCGHVFEVKDLDRWIDSYQDGVKDQSGIQMKFCPRCYALIRKTKRYSTVINQILCDIELVKAEVFGNTADIQRTRADLLRLCETRVLEADDGDIKYDVIRLTLESTQRLPSRNALICVENMLSVLKSVDAISKDAKSQFVFELSKRNDISELEEHIRSLVNTDLKEISEWALNKAVSSEGKLSEQELHEASQELERISSYKSLFLLLKCAADRSFTLPHDLESRADALRKLHHTGAVLSQVDKDELKNIVADLKKVVPVSGLKISEEERVQIIQAMGLAKGHWYKCAKGHVYAIGDCGGASEGGQCPACKGTIGGYNHALAPGNQLASEMDGAAFPAWSDEANMEMGAAGALP